MLWASVEIICERRFCRVVVFNRFFCADGRQREYVCENTSTEGRGAAWIGGHGYSNSVGPRSNFSMLMWLQNAT